MNISLKDRLSISMSRRLRASMAYGRDVPLCNILILMETAIDELQPEGGSLDDFRKCVKTARELCEQI